MKNLKLALFLLLPFLALAQAPKPGGSGGGASGSVSTAYTCVVSAVSSVACTHNLNTSYPWAVCYDSSGNMLGGSGASTAVTGVVATSANIATVTFSGTTTGTCVVSSGSMGPAGANGAAGTNGAAGATGPAGTVPVGAQFGGVGGTVIASGTYTSCFVAPITGTPAGWSVVGQGGAGTAIFAVRTATQAAYNSGGGDSGFAGYTDVTGGGTAPTISGAASVTGSSMTSWTSLTKGDVVCFRLSSPSVFTAVNVLLTF